MAHFEGIKELSNLSLAGRSSLHDVYASTSNLDAAFDVELLEPGQFDLSAPPTGKLEVYVQDLKSRSYLDVAVNDRLDTRRYPRITVILVELREAGEGNYEAAGEIAFHGVTRNEKSEVSIRWLDDKTLEVKGEIKIDVRDYNVEIPKMITSTVDPEVRVRLRLMLKRSPDS